MEKVKTILKHPLFTDFWRAIAGGLAISFGTYASKMCPWPILAPLLFSVGIAIVMSLDLHLITRHFPVQKLGWAKTPIIIVANLLAAYLVGLFTDLSYTAPDNLFALSIFGGVVIGLVSKNNLVASPYQLPIFLITMFVFVALGLPHCVVVAFCNADILTILTVLAGNIVGGLLLRGLFHLVTGEK